MDEFQYLDGQETPSTDNSVQNMKSCDRNVMVSLKKVLAWEHKTIRRNANDNPEIILL